MKEWGSSIPAFDFELKSVVLLQSNRNEVLAGCKLMTGLQLNKCLREMSDRHRHENSPGWGSFESKCRYPRRYRQIPVITLYFEPQNLNVVGIKSRIHRSDICSVQI